ncbi:MAG: GNAT family N-acetyltransferase [Gammaproteobacteria bacterium]|nr:GNAT family N-acetyltransferase [Gammaproteobacteria bacterium]
MNIRAAGAADAEAILEIYRPIVLHTAISFETRAPAAEEMLRRIEAAQEKHSWIVCEVADEIAGYAYAGMLRLREAYQYSTEVSAYVAEAHRGRGYGLQLYAALAQELRQLGYCNLYAAITMPNDASVALHGRAGFRHVGTFPNVGRKFERWHDVSWWHLHIDEPWQTDEP